MTDWNSAEGARKGHDLAREQAEQMDEQVEALTRFARGQRARDRDGDGESQMLVLGVRDIPAREHHIDAIGQTVAEANPEYPADDPIADVAFVESIENALGIDWDVDDVLQLDADGDLDRARIKRYAYPVSRLAPVEEESDV